MELDSIKYKSDFRFQILLNSRRSQFIDQTKAFGREIVVVVVLHYNQLHSRK